MTERVLVSESTDKSHLHVKNLAWVGIKPLKGRTL